jgi:hypothetical protein
MMHLIWETALIFFKLFKLLVLLMFFLRQILKICRIGFLLARVAMRIDFTVDAYSPIYIALV